MNGGFSMRIKCTLLVCCIALSLITVSCKGVKNNEVIDFNIGNYEIFSYPLENVSSFDVDDNGNLYFPITYDTGRYKTVDSIFDGHPVDLPIYESMLYVVDKAGNTIANYIFDEEVTLYNVVYFKNAIYYTIDSAKGNAEVPVLCKFDLTEEKKTELYVLNGFSSIKKMVEINGVLYILGYEKGLLGKQINLFDRSDDYVYSGEVIIAYNIETDAYSDFYSDLPISISKTPNNKLMIYSYDENGGYGFLKYTPENNSFSSKIYSDFRMLYDFAMFSETEFIYSNQFINRRVIAADFTSKESIAELLDDIPLISGFICKNEYFYYVDYDDSHRVKRINLTERLELRKLGTINIISAEYVYEAPISSGFNVNRQDIGYDDFALRVLSQDSNYEICAINSRQPFASAIRDKGSFYPLNGIKGVEEYIDACFPFIKSAATDKNGNIWMIPVAINPAVIVYNENLCKALGIDMSGGISAEQFINGVDSLYKNGKHNALYSVQAEFLTENLISQYLNAHNSFNTTSFKRLADLLKNKVFENYNAFNMSDEMARAYYNGDYSDVALLTVNNTWQHSGLASNQNFRVAPFPYVDDNSVTIIDCVFLSVNPNAANLNAALAYISQIVNTLSNDENNLMLADNPLYESGEYFRGLREIYKNGAIRFSFDHSIFMNDFYSYIDNKLSLDRFISEADRKLRMYLNE